MINEYAFFCRHCRSLGLYQSVINQIFAGRWTQQYIHVFFCIEQHDPDVLRIKSKSSQDWFRAVLHNVVSRKESYHVRANGRCRFSMYQLLSFNFYALKLLFYWSCYFQIDGSIGSDWRSLERSVWRSKDSN